MLDCKKIPRDLRGPAWSAGVTVDLNQEVDGMYVVTHHAALPPRGDEGELIVILSGSG